jgi:hypothetical protein
MISMMVKPTEVQMAPDVRAGGTGRARLIALLCSAAVSLVAASPADALYSSFSCSDYVSAQTCWAGTGYHGYDEVSIGTFAAYGARSEMCAKAQTQAGSIKAGSGCNNNALGRVSCLSNTEPISAGYGYWAGSGSPAILAGQVASPTDSPDC